MSLRLRVQLSGDAAEELRTIRDRVEDRAGMNARIAAETEGFIKRYGPTVASTKHRTADSLGARPTGHLADAYQAIESRSDETEAVMLIPRASRLRAAFGSYEVTPVNSKFLTIPKHADAYGRRAREFDDLFVIRGKKGGLMLVRRSPRGRQVQALRGRTYQRRNARRVAKPEIEIMYILAKRARIAGDETLIPMNELTEKAASAANAYVDDMIERSVLS